VQVGAVSTALLDISTEAVRVWPSDANAATAGTAVRSDLYGCLAASSSCRTWERTSAMAASRSRAMRSDVPPGPSVTLAHDASRPYPTLLAIESPRAMESLRIIESNDGSVFSLWMVSMLARRLDWRPLLPNETTPAPPIAPATTCAGSGTSASGGSIVRLRRRGLCITRG